MLSQFLIPNRVNCDVACLQGESSSTKSLASHLYNPSSWYDKFPRMSAVPLKILLSTSMSLPSMIVSLLSLVSLGVMIAPLGVIHLVVYLAPVDCTPQDKKVEGDSGLNSVGIVTSSKCEKIVTSVDGNNYIGHSYI